MLNLLKRVLCLTLLVSLFFSLSLISNAAEVNPVPQSRIVTSNAAATSNSLIYVPDTDYAPTHKDYLAANYLDSTSKMNFYGIVVSSLENYPADQLKTEFNITYVFEEAGGELLSYDDIIDVLFTIFSDHAEFFWFYSVGYGSYYDSTEDAFVITIYIYASSIWTEDTDLQNDEKNFEAEVDRIVAAAPKTNVYETIKYFDQWLCDNNVYCVLGGDRPFNVSNTAVSGILSKNDEYTGPVCQGYSTAFKYLCDKAGILCVMVLGNAYEPAGIMGAHAWNYVNVEGAWYALDITWNDSMGDKSHFMVGSQTSCIPSNGSSCDQWYESHKTDMSTDCLRDSYPTLSTTAYVYNGTSSTAIPDTTATPIPVEYKLELLDSNGQASISSGYIEGIDETSTSDEVKVLFNYSDHIKILKDNIEIGSSDLVGTGCVIQIVDDNNSVVEEASVVIKGDVNGDGKVAALDYMLVKRQLKKGVTFTGAIFKAADIDGGNVINASDYMKIKRHIIGNYDFC